MALQIYGAMRERREIASNAQRAALSVAHLVGAHLHLLVGAANGYVGSAARSPAAAALKSGQPVCDAVFGEPRSGIRFARVILLDTDGRDVCRLGPRSFDSLGAAGRAAVARALRTEAPSPLHVEQGNAMRASFVIAAPIEEEGGRTLGAVAAELDEGSLSGLILAADIPEGGLLSVVGQDGTMLFRYPDHHGWAGRDVSGFGFYRAMAGKSEGTGTADGLDGLRRFFAFTTVENVFTAGQQHVAVAIPITSVTAAANRAMYASLLLLVPMAVAGLVAAAMFSERAIHAPASQVARAADRIAAGDVHARADLHGTLQEFASLGAAFDKMAETVERHVAERTAELDLANRRLELATQNKSEFLGEMSHELRTPLNAIMGFTQLMHAGRVGPVTAAQQEYLGDVLTSAAHLLRIVNQLLDLTRVEAGKMIFVAGDVNVDLVVKEVCDGLRPLSAERGVGISCDVQPQVRHVVGDAHRLKQVLYNYLANALRFAPKNDTVIVRVEPDGDERFRLIVKDTGPGIAEADLPRLFGRYEQGDRSGADHQGTGLGLALTRRLVEAQGGYAGVTTQPGRGAAFFAVLPRDIRTTVSPELLDVAVATRAVEESPDIPRREPKR